MACVCNGEPGSHNGQPVAPIRPRSAASVSIPSGASSALEELRRRMEKTTATVSATATGSATRGKSAKSADKSSREGHRDHRSHLVRRPPTTAMSQVSETSWANSPHDGMGPWKTKDPSPVAINAKPTHLARSIRRSHPPATTKASVVTVLTGWPSTSYLISSQSPTAPTCSK